MGAADAGFVAGLMKDFSSSQAEMRQRKMREDLLQRQKDFQDFQMSEAERSRYIQSLQKIVEGDWPAQAKALAAQYAGDAATMEKWNPKEMQKRFAEIMDASAREVPEQPAPQVQAARNFTAQHGGGDPQQGAQNVAQVGEVLPQGGLIAASAMPQGGGFAQALTQGMQDLGGQLSQQAETAQTPDQTRQVSGPLTQWELAAQAAQERQGLLDQQFQDFQRRHEFTQSQQPEWSMIDRSFDPLTGQYLERNERTGETRAAKPDQYTPSPQRPTLNNVGGGTVIKQVFNPETGQWEEQKIQYGTAPTGDNIVDLGGIPGLEHMAGTRVPISKAKTYKDLYGKAQSGDLQSGVELNLMGLYPIESFTPTVRGGMTDLFRNEYLGTIPYTKEHHEKLSQFDEAEAALLGVQEELNRLQQASVDGTLTDFGEAMLQYKSFTEPIAIKIGRSLGEVGVFTDRDVQRYETLFAGGHVLAAMLYMENRYKNRHIKDEDKAEELAMAEIERNPEARKEAAQIEQAARSGQYGVVGKMFQERIDRTHKLFDRIVNHSLGGDLGRVKAQRDKYRKEFGFYDALGEGGDEAAPAPTPQTAQPPAQTQQMDISNPEVSRAIDATAAKFGISREEAIKMLQQEGIF